MSGADRPSLALHCDEYLLTMAQSFWRHGQNERCVFELAVRELPRNRAYLIAAGLDTALEYLESLRFEPPMLEWLDSTGTYQPEFLEFLAGIGFAGDIDAVAEGTVVGAGTPLLRVTAPRIQATLLESALLAIVNHQTMIASKAARIVEAASGRPVWDFSLRRLHGVHAGLGVARAAYIAGAAGTATVVAGQQLGIPTTGTMAHQYILGFGLDQEQRAFEQFLGDYPERAVLLVDTFDTLRGIDRAIAASLATGVSLAAIRLDSGDLPSLCREARRRLDLAGMTATGIVVSGDLDEWRVASLLAGGAPVTAFGVGTMLGTSADAPHLTGVYKLVAQESVPAGGPLTPVMKWSSAKISDPGVHQLFRLQWGDTLGLADEALAGEALIQPVMREGRRLGAAPGLAVVRDHCRSQRQGLPEALRRLDGYQTWRLRRSPGLLHLRRRLMGGVEVSDDTEQVIDGVEGTALIAVDVQADFLPGGALGVAGGDAVVDALVEVAGGVDLVVATRDFHPADHFSFHAQGGRWPAHCVAGTAGAGLHPAIDAVADLVVSKGRHPDRDAYSGFDDTELAAILRDRGVGRVVIGGLATDYCVRATALDAVAAGFETHVLLPAVRAVELSPGDGDAALEQMRRAGVSLEPSWPAARRLAGSPEPGAASAG